MTDVSKAAFLILIAAMAASGQFLLNGGSLKEAPKRNPRVEWIEPERAMRLERALWLDARATDLYRESHREGALQLSLEEWDAQLPQFLDAWQPGTKVIVYCSPGSCESSEAVAARLAEALPEETIYVLKGGWPFPDEKL